ncbi:hypothetical protein [Spirosoma fluminis]
MSTSPALQKALPSLGKFGLWLGITALSKHLTGSTELAAALATVGVGAEHIGGACEIVSSLASGKLSDYYKEIRSNAHFGINHDLQGAMQGGMGHALAELQTDFFAQETLSNQEADQIRLYFRSLIYHISHKELTDDLVNEYILDRSEFFDNLLKRVHELPANNEPTEVGGIADVFILVLTDETSQKLIEFLLKNLEPYAQRYINEELKGNDKAKTAYFIHLLEYSARVNQDNAVVLQEISQALNDVEQVQQEHTDLLRQIAQSQQLIYDSLRKLRVDLQVFVNDFADFKQRIDERYEPVLNIPDLNPDNLPTSFSYQYALRYTSFISREEEINQLWGS